MTRGVIGRVVLGVWLGCFTAAAGQLPPDIQVDRYLLRAERLMEAKDPKGALELMGKIVALQKEHGLTLPKEFHFKHAKVALSAGEVQEALEAVNKYLVEAGREGKFYREALELLEEAEQLQSWFDPEQLCADKSKGAECWKELTGEPGCYVWNDYLIPDQTVNWTGECAAGRAQGEGTLKWVWGDGENTSESTGSLADGTKQGDWVERRSDGSVAKQGPYKEGKKHGHWVHRMVDGTVYEEGPYAKGKKHGHWVERTIDDDVWEGLYEEGKRHGNWVWRLANGTVWEGPYVEEKLQGHWVGRYKDGSVHEGTVVDGKRHGDWVERYADGQIHEGSYVEGEKDGQWVERWTDGAVKYVTFERGKRVGVASSGNLSRGRSTTAGGPQPVSAGIRAGETVVYDGMEFVGIPPGRYRMGSTRRHAEDYEQPVTRVQISQGFYLGKYEVSQAEWQAVMGNNPSSFSGCGNCPVEQVSWEDVQAFIGKLNARSGGGRYRLPTEAEWEYAARAGTKRDTYAGDLTEPYGNDPVLNGIAWYEENSGGRTQPVGQKAPNGFGLYDMLGNVWEWAGDWYGTYPGGAVTDPAGPGTGSGRVYRGGNWNFSAGYCRSAARNSYSPGIRRRDLGFRLLRTE